MPFGVQYVAIAEIVKQMQGMNEKGLQDTKVH